MENCNLGICNTRGKIIRVGVCSDGRGKGKITAIYVSRPTQDEASGKQVGKLVDDINYVNDILDDMVEALEDIYIGIFWSG